MLCSLLKFVHFKLTVHFRLKVLCDRIFTLRSRVTLIWAITDMDTGEEKRTVS